jgi:hypothetical protein
MTGHIRDKNPPFTLIQIDDVEVISTHHGHRLEVEGQSEIGVLSKVVRHQRVLQRGRHLQFPSEAAVHIFQLQVGGLQPAQGLGERLFPVSGGHSIEEIVTLTLQPGEVLLKTINGLTQ